MKLALAVNPKSGSRRSPEELAARFRRLGHEVETYTLAQAGAAASSGADRVVVAGGDGSMGCVFAACAEHGASLAILPAGTANDFARAVGVPADWEAAVRLAADPHAPHRAVWGATLDGHPFVNVASIGLAVNAAREAAPLKSLLGPVAYGIGAGIATVKGREVETRIEVDGREVYEGRVWQALVAASGSFGGVVQLPTSDLATPEIEVFVVEAGNRLELARRVWTMRPGGDGAGVPTFQGREIRIDVEPNLHWNVDGEVLDLGDVTARPLGPVEVFLPEHGAGSAR
ncbi:diacylglycerol/lipid kinase family protein [Patulibacter sp. S7RM1-6]